MPISKIKTSSILSDASSTNLSIDAGTLFLDSSNNRVGVGTTSPAQALDVVGSIKSSALTSGRVPYASTGGLIIDSANLLYSGTDLTVYGLTVGRGLGA